MFWVFLRFLRSLDGRNGFSRSRSIGSTPGIMGIPSLFMNLHKLQIFIREKYNDFFQKSEQNLAKT